MNKTITLGLALVFVVSVLGFALADSENSIGMHEDDGDMMSGNGSDGVIIGGDLDEHGCLVGAGFSWNDSEGKCVREWENGTMRYQEMEQHMERERVQSGEHMSEGDEMFRVETKANNRVKLEAGGVGVECDCNMTQEQIQNKTRLHVTLSNGKNAEVKVMPDTASERALERLRLKVCSEENNCTLELKEVGEGEKTQLAYELQTQRKARFLGIFGTSISVRAEVNAENGEVMSVKKPWWAFLASEPAEE